MLIKLLAILLEEPIPSPIKENNFQYSGSPIILNIIRLNIFSFVDACENLV